MAPATQPRASVHLLRDEVTAATARRTALDRMRYRPQQWSTRQSWQPSSVVGGDAWFGFEGVREMAGVGPDVLLVPLVGHTLGHAGVAVRRESGWLFYAADAHFYHAEMNARPRCTPGLRFYQTMMEKDRGLRLLNQRRLRALRQDEARGSSIFGAHDVREFERLSGHSHRTAIRTAVGETGSHPVDAIDPVARGLMPQGAERSF